MSISISFVDLKLIDQLAPYNSIELIHPNLDKLMKQCLSEIGFDIKSEIQYVPSKHRSLQGKIVIDFVAVGEMSRDRKFRHMFDALQRTVVAGMEDASLGKEMGEMLGKTRRYEPAEGVPKMSKKDKQYREENDFDLLEGEDDSAEYVEDDWESVSIQIQQLVDIRDVIRAGVNIKQTGKGK